VDDQRADELGPVLRVQQGEGGAPRAAEDEVPFGDGEVGAEDLEVGEEVPRRVVPQLGGGGGAAAAALVEEDDAVG